MPGKRSSSKLLERISYLKENGELRSGTGEDIIIISGPALRTIFQANKNLLGPGAHLLWYDAGKKVGSTDGKRYRERGKDKRLDETLRFAAEVYTGLGWGRVEVASFDLAGKHAVFRIRNGVFVRGGKSDEPLCAFPKGFLEGLLTEIIGSEVRGAEEGCQAKAGEYCEFVMEWV